MIFFECGDIALFEAFYMLRDHNHVKMKFWNVTVNDFITSCSAQVIISQKPAQGENFKNVILIVS